MRKKKVKIQFGCDLNSFDKKGVHIKVGKLAEIKVFKPAQKEMLYKFYKEKNKHEGGSKI